MRDEETRRKGDEVRGANRGMRNDCFAISSSICSYLTSLAGVGIGIFSPVFSVS